MNDIDKLRSFVFNQMNTHYYSKTDITDYKTYYCNHPNKYHKDYGDESSYNADDFYICYFTNATSLNINNTTGLCNNSSFYSYVINFKTGFSKTYNKDTKHSVLTTNGYSNISSNVSSSTYNIAPNSSYDLLIDTDYYSHKDYIDFYNNFNDKISDLKSSLGSSTGSISSSVDMTITNNLLWTIGLILCVILLLGFLRKIFNRGVN